MKHIYLTIWVAAVMAIMLVVIAAPALAHNVSDPGIT